MGLVWAPGQGVLLRGCLAFLEPGDGDVMAQMTENGAAHLFSASASHLYHGRERIFKVGRVESTSLRRN